jgi:hypothetical protein
MTEWTGMFAKSISKVLRFEQEVCGWEKMREDKTEKMWIVLEAKLKLVSKEGIDNAYVMKCLPL